MIHQVRGHIAQRAGSPVDPAAPVERVVDQMVVDLRRRPEVEIRS
jgi:hypothetical protein